MEYKIEKGKKIPPANSKETKYPLSEMKVGDSFLVEYINRNSLYQCAKSRGVKVTIRREGDKARVWRIE